MEIDKILKRKESGKWKKMYTEDKEEIEIDLRELLFELKKRLWLILVALFLGIGIAGAGSAFLTTPTI